MISISVIHPLPIYYHGICHLVNTHKPQLYHCQTYTSSAKEALHHVNDWIADIVIIGIYNTHTEEIKLIEAIKKKSKKCKIIIISRLEYAEIVRRAFIKGVNGFMYGHAEADEFFEVLEKVSKNEVYMPPGFRIHPDFNQFQSSGGSRQTHRLDFHLTHREKEVLNFICLGHSNIQISEKLFISDQTVAVHRKNLFRKMGVKNSISLMHAAKEKKLIS